MPLRPRFAASSGYPHITIPFDLVDGLPVGISFISTAWDDKSIIEMAYAFEQENKFNEFYPPPSESKKEQDLKYGKIVDAPKPPLKKEKPKSEELLAKFDNRAHSNQKKITKKIYKRKKTIVPKSRSVIGSLGSRSTNTKKVPTSGSGLYHL